MIKEKLKILAVDDIYANRFLLANSLTNYNVIVTANAVEFWNEISYFEPDLILMDIMLPGEDGFEIVRKLKLNEKYENIPVIFISAKSSKSDVNEAIISGGNDYIIKPIDESILSKKIRNVLFNHILKYIQANYGENRKILIKKTHNCKIVLYDISKSNIQGLKKFLNQEFNRNFFEGNQTEINSPIVLYENISNENGEKFIEELDSFGANAYLIEILNISIQGKDFSDIEKNEVNNYLDKYNFFMDWQNKF